MLPATNKTINAYVDYCYKTNNDPKTYTKCITKRLKFINQKEDELSHKLMYVKAKFDQCKKLHKTYEECIDEAKKVGKRSIERFVSDVEKY